VLTLGAEKDVPPAADLAAYEEAKSTVGRDADAQVHLALWCEAHGLPAERLKHLALAVLSDPTNATARGLLGLVAYGGQWKRPDAVAAKVKADEALSAKLAEYDLRRSKTNATLEDQYKLARWCEENGLTAEAKAHFATVARLDPGHELARKHLGYKKVRGQWMTESERAAEAVEDEAQKKADQHWKPLLTKWRNQQSAKAQSEEAEKGLAAVDDPRAVPSVWAVFVTGTKGDHGQAVRILGQIDAPGASRGLAWLAVYDASPEVRRAAAETLMRRDPREFAESLIRLIRDPIKFEVRPVKGPGAPGEIVINGERARVKRLYAPPALPQIFEQPGDKLTSDAEGRPVIVRPLRKFKTGEIFASYLLSGNPADPYSVAVQNSLAMRPMTPITRFNFTLVSGGEIPIGQIAEEVQKTAVVAAHQLEEDVASLESTNAEIRRTNERVLPILKEVAGRDYGHDTKQWERWWVDQIGFQIVGQKVSQEIPTVVVNVPIAYRAPPLNVGAAMPIAYSRASCFGGGTLVRTRDGAHPIESLQVGDQVLSLNVKTGALGYQPVLLVHHNPPSSTFLVKINGDTIVSSPFHRFWVAGKGWVMARDMKGGETLRLLDGPAKVTSVETGETQPVFNLDVAEDHDFFAGSAGALVHDNTLPDTRLAPFDATPELEAVVSRK
jgi:hypothetical protein